MAAIIAHESHHGAYPQCANGGGPAVCFDEEVAAFKWQASVWQSVRPFFNQETNLTRSLDHLVETWRTKGLRDYVLTNTGYQKNYLGKEIAN